MSAVSDHPPQCGLLAREVLAQAQAFCGVRLRQFLDPWPDPTARVPTTPGGCLADDRRGALRAHHHRPRFPYLSPRRKISR